MKEKLGMSKASGYAAANMDKPVVETTTHQVTESMGQRLLLMKEKLGMSKASGHAIILSSVCCLHRKFSLGKW